MPAGLGRTHACALAAASLIMLPTAPLTQVSLPPICTHPPPPFPCLASSSPVALPGRHAPLPPRVLKPLRLPARRGRGCLAAARPVRRRGPGYRARLAQRRPPPRRLGDRHRATLVRQTGRRWLGRGPADCSRAVPAPRRNGLLRVRASEPPAQPRGAQSILPAAAAARRTPSAQEPREGAACADRVHPAPLLWYVAGCHCGQGMLPSAKLRGSCPGGDARGCRGEGRDLVGLAGCWNEYRKMITGRAHTESEAG